MDISQCSFSEINSSELLSDYTSNFSKVKEFYSFSPFEDSEIIKKSESVNQYDNKAEVAEALKEYHNYLGIEEEQRDVLAKFKEADVQVVVTGQQLGLFGGPLFTAYKTLTTIILAQRWSELTAKEVIPVFWMADEDHDYEEINIVGLPGYKDFETHSLPGNNSSKPVSEIEISEIENLLSQLNESLQATDFTESLISKMKLCYSESETHAQAFAKWMSFMFSKHGVLIVGSNHKSIKKLLVSDFERSVSERDSIQKFLQSSSNAISDLYHQQVQIGSSNLFYLDGEKGRTKVSYENNQWLIDGLDVLTTDELINLIKVSPELFSPNVFLRPVIQDSLLPTIAYVAGPGELSYYGQMKEYYQVFEKEMPIIVPRLSCTLIESGISRSMESLPFELGSFGKRIEDLISDYMSMQDGYNPNTTINNWIKSSKESALQYVEEIEAFDKSLKASAERVISVFETELNKLRGKLNKSAKQQEETQLNRIRKVKSQLYPGDGLQERQVSLIHFMNKYGLDVFDKILDQMNSEKFTLREHHIIRM